MKEINVKEMFAGLFLAKFDRIGLEKLGFTKFNKAFEALAAVLGGNEASIKNYRDEFDPVFPENGRKGWCNRPMHPTRAAMLRQYGQLDIEEMYTKLIEMFSGIEEYVDKIDNIFNKTQCGTDVAKEAGNVKFVSNPTPWLQDFDPTSIEGKERIDLTATRVNQGMFRDWMLNIYHGQCCICGLNVPTILRASHIVEWSKDETNRMNPENGLCLSATYDAAFDKHLISLDENYCVILAPSLREYCTNVAFHEQFKRIEGKKISMPWKFRPSPQLLEIHRNICVKN